jgi:rare lipoprotein A
MADTQSMKRIILLLAVWVSPVFLVSGQTQQGSGNGSFLQEGIASWYGDEFAGRPTASGEIFDPALLTAAHPTFPFGTMLLVTNTHNNKQVMVRVNDRGPFVSNRILDVSRAAAVQLDMIATGTAPVRVEALGPVAGGTAGIPPAAGGAVGTPPAAPWETHPTPPAPVIISEYPAVRTPEIPPPAIAEPAPNMPVPEYRAEPPASAIAPLPLTAAMIPGIPPAGSGTYRLQVGSYKIARYALEAFDKLKKLGLTPAYERYGDFYRVVLSGINAEEIPSLAERLGTAGFLEVLIRGER